MILPDRGCILHSATTAFPNSEFQVNHRAILFQEFSCLLYTSDAADERSSVDLGGRRIIKKKKNTNIE